MRPSDIRQKGSYEIAGKWKDPKIGKEITRKVISGYIYDLGELKVGITNKTPDGKNMKAWAATILPEGLLWRSFRTRQAFEEFLAKDAENLIRMVTQVRKERGNNG